MRNLALAFGLAAAVCAPAWAAEPAFTNPTRVNNPFYPVALSRQALALGHAGDAALRTEATLLPGTMAIDWSGGRTDCIVNLFVAYLDGELAEVAYDYFAQGDDGTVYYFGEDVFNYENGVVANTEGTWRAGRDGAPPGVIMTPRPMVGQVFRPENFPPVVLEIDRVLSVTERLSTPRGPIADGVRVREQLMDGSVEFKMYARGFGEVSASTEDELTNLVVLTRTDAPRGRVPVGVEEVESRAEDVLKSLGRWPSVRSHAAAIDRAWKAERAGVVAAGAPAMLIAQVDGLIPRLVAAAAGQKTNPTRRLAGELRTASLDLSSFWNPRVTVDVQRLEAAVREVLISVKAGEWRSARVKHAAARDALWARLRPYATARRGARAPAGRLDAALADLDRAIEARSAGAGIRASRSAMEAIDAVEEAY